MTILDFKCGDASQATSYNHIADHSVDLILCDPPFYPRSQQYKQIREENVNQLKPILTPSAKEYEAWWNACLTHWTRVIKPSGWLIFKADHYTAKMTFHWMINNSSWEYHNEIIWNKKKLGLGYYIRNQTEHLEIYRPIPSKNSYFWYVGQKEAKNHLHSAFHGDNQTQSLRSLVEFQGYNAGIWGKQQNTEQIHINQTPIPLWELILQWFCPKSGLVLDPFAGSASVGKACFETYHYYGLEFDTDIFQETTHQLATLKKTGGLLKFVSN